MAIILGGDGTLLRTQTKMTEEIQYSRNQYMGTVGFLTESEVNEHLIRKKILRRILPGKRTMISCFTPRKPSLFCTE